MIGTSCAGIFTGHTGELLPSSVHPLSKVCSKAKSSLRTGTFADTTCAMSLEKQLIMFSEFVSMRLDRTKSSWALADDVAFCAEILSCPC